MNRSVRVFSLLLLWLIAPALPAQGISIDKVLVIVNDEAITFSEYQARHRREMLQRSSNVAPFDGRVNSEILEQMITDRIQSQAASRRGIEISDAEVEQAIAFIARQNDRSVSQLLSDLDRDGISPAQFRASVEEQQRISRLLEIMVNSRVKVSDQEVENYLNSHRELIESDEAYEVSHLFVDIEGKTDADIQRENENLENIRAAMIQGRSFEQSVEEFSDDPLKQRGGYLGWRKQNQLPELFLEALRSTEVGGVTPIIRSNNGLHLIKLHDRQGGGQVAQQQLVRHILLRQDENVTEADVRELADELVARIEAGEEFDKLARIHSSDFSSREEGGLIGWTNPGDFGGEIGAMLERLPLNQVSRPVRSPAGYHIFEVLDRRHADISEELASRAAREAIYRRKAAELYDNWYGTIRDAAYIEYVMRDQQS